MVNYEEGRIKLTNTQLNKLKYARKNKTGATLIIGKKNFQDDALQKFLQKAKVGNVFAIV